MKKIKLKLSHRELNDLILYLRSVIATEGQTPTEMLIDACLAELLHKLLKAEVMFLDKYKIVITPIYALALLAIYHDIPSDNITIRNIASHIHQKAE